ncbi:MAG: polysaccharide biosynthesis protein [Oscillospiraceae bacterium]|nr:polysaccharide biosynthesis protein [Oscillospiraceae bacterium]
METGKQHYIKGAAILAAASVFVKIIGAIYKIPLFQDGVLGDEGSGDFQVTYSVYTLILTISTAGVPVAMSRLVSSARATNDTGRVRRYFNVALPAFALIGLIAMLIMLLFAEGFANIMNNSMAAPGIRVLAPAVLFGCIIAVYRGYTQGFENMVPTAMSQVVEVLSKAVFGISAALWLVQMGYASNIVSAGAIIGVTIGLALCVPLLVYYKRKVDKNITISEDSFKLPTRSNALKQIIKVSVPITLSASFMAIMVVIDSSIVLGRLQSALHFTEVEARGMFGMFSRALTVYNLPPSLVVPVSISIIPAIAAALASKKGKEAGIIMQSSVKLINLIALPAATGLMILATPILIALYRDDRELTSTMLVILGAASFFVCLQFITTAILQANGHERIALLTFPIGAAIKIFLAWFLAGQQSFGILGSPIGTLACFVVISILNIVFIKVLVKENKPKFFKVFLKPILCSTVMAGIAFGCYSILYKYGSAILGTSRTAVIIYLAITIMISFISYGILTIVTRTITMDDMKLIPRGEKLAKVLHIK